jgi:hypothetical protein
VEFARTSIAFHHPGCRWVKLQNYPRFQRDWDNNLAVADLVDDALLLELRHGSPCRICLPFLAGMLRAMQTYNANVDTLPLTELRKLTKLRDREQLLHARWEAEADEEDDALLLTLIQLRRKLR